MGTYTSCSQYLNDYNAVCVCPFRKEYLIKFKHHVHLEEQFKTSDDFNKILTYLIYQ